MNSSLLLTLGIFPLFSSFSTISLFPTRVFIIKIIVYVHVFWLGSESLIQHYFFFTFLKKMLAVWVLSHGACVWPRGLAPAQWSPATAGKNCWDFIAVKHYVRPLALPHPSWALPLNKPVSFGHLWITGFPVYSVRPTNEKRYWSLYVQK